MKDEGFRNTLARFDCVYIIKGAALPKHFAAGKIYHIREANISPAKRISHLRKQIYHIREANIYAIHQFVLFSILSGWKVWLL